MYKFLLLFLFASTLKVYAQNDIININLGWRETSSNPIKTNIIQNNKLGLTCIAINDTVKLKGLILNKSLKQEQNFEIIGLEYKNVLGGYIENNLVSVFANDDNGFIMKNLTFDLHTKQAAIHDIMFKPNNEKFLGQLNSDNAFLYITAHKKEPRITVYKFTENKVDTLIYDFNKISENSFFNKNELWYALTKQDGLGRSIDVAVVKPGLNYDIDVANSPNKIYLTNNNLVLLMDKTRGETMIFNLNLERKEIDYRKITRVLDKSAATVDIPTFNSYLLENHLYYVDASLQKLTFIVNDFKTGEELKKIETVASDTINFKNTPILLEGSLYGMGEIRELEKTIQLLRKMVRGKAVVVASKNAGKHELTIGAFKEIKQSGAPMMMGGGFATVPVYAFAGMGRSFNQLTRFKSLFDPLSNQHINGYLGLSAFEKMQNYVSNSVMPKKSMNMFAVDDYYYLTYYVKKENTFMIKEFKRD